MRAVDPRCANRRGPAVPGPARARIHDRSGAAPRATSHETRVTVRFDANRWRQGDLAVGGATLVLFVALFLPWFTFSVAGVAVPFLPESALGAHGWMYLVVLSSLGIVGYLVRRAMWEDARCQQGFDASICSAKVGPTAWLSARAAARQAHGRLSTSSVLPARKE